MSDKKINYIRQSSLIDIESYRDNKISIIGCGAIGSFVGISLAKMGLTQFRLVDFDKVELHNLPNQFFNMNDIGNYKSTALAASSFLITTSLNFTVPNATRAFVLVCCLL